MNVVRSVLSVAIAYSVSACMAADPPTPQAVRDAVARSFPFLEKEGVAWMKERACISCHQLPGMVWSLGEARGDIFTAAGNRFAVVSCNL